MATTLTGEQTLRSKVSIARVARWVKGGNIACVRALSVIDFNAVMCLDDTRLLLNSSFGINLRAEAIFDAQTIGKNVKQFSGELLDRCTPNHWKTTLRRGHACMNTRWSVASSLFSIRKILSSKKPDVGTYVKSMTTASPPLDPSFAIFASAEIGRIFETGWDRGYWNCVENFTPPTKSNCDKRKKGTYRDRAVAGDLGRGRFRRWAGGTCTDAIPSRVRATAIETGGKWRVITLSEPRLANLQPLHRTLYNRLSKEKWLARGEATTTMFSEFGRRQGEVFVSGDYESATDNININVTELVLRRLFDSATHIPTRVREEALCSLRLSFETSRKKFLGTLKKGQLMGSPLSFPLLCLINYLTFRYAVRRDVPVKINGDDIVFRCTPDEADRWFKQVELSGLVVSKGKTLLSSTSFSLNSTYFRSFDSGARLIPHFRASTIRKKCEDMGALAGRVAQIKRDLADGALRYKSLEILLRKNLGMIYSAQGSFGVRFDCTIPVVVLRRLKLIDREAFYLGLQEPAPVEKYTGVRQQVVPPEWKKSGDLMRRGPEIDPAVVRKEMVDRSWDAPIVRESRDEWWDRCRKDTYRYVPFRKLTFHLYRKFTRVHFRPSVSYPEKNEKKWCDNSKPDGALTRPVAFVYGGIAESSVVKGVSYIDDNADLPALTLEQSRFILPERRK
uniref:RNA-dependent RNA polymerase n=1 Tax=Hulunbuir Botou tick virus 8 TaxID=2972069 RepID=A0A9E7V209_9VIRU|nr:MAG: RNA-dependent RNA polymerase [Hulunbuir Botou tick virus 8]